MPSVTSLLALLCVVLTVNYVSAQQVGDPRVHLFFEYLRPYWRRHRARIRPFVFARVVPLWRVARSIELDENSVNCVHVNSTNLLMCAKNNRPVVCEVVKNIPTDISPAFNEFQMSEKKVASNETKSVRFALYPKRDSNEKQQQQVTADELRQENENKMLSLHGKDLESTDNGFTVVNNKCWEQMVELLTSATFRKEIKVEKSNIRHEIWTDKELTIGNLVVAPY